MAENDGTAQGTGDSNSNGNNAGTDTGQQNSSTSTNTGSGEGGTLTQAQVDAIVKDRLAREREKYKGFDDLKRKAEEFDKIQTANQTETEKLQTELQRASERATTAESKYQTTLKRAAIIDEASKQKAVNPSLVAKLLADEPTLELTDDGDVKGAAEAVTALLEANPYLRGSGFTGNGDGGQRTNSGLPQFTRSQIADPAFFREHQKEIMDAQRAGRIIE